MRRPSQIYPLLILVVLGMTAACNKLSNSRNDTQIISAIDAKLYQNPDLKNASVNVASKDGVVTLAGTVNAPLEKLAVEDIALKTAGVKQVVDQLTVANAQTPEAESGARPAPDEASAEPVRPVRRTHPRRTRRLAANEAAPAAGEKDEPANSASSAATAQAAQTAQPPENAQSAPPPAPVQVTIPPGTTVTVRLVDSISSETAQPDQTYAASLAAPLVANDRVVIPRGADAKVRVVQVARAGHYEGRSELKLELVNLSYNGADYRVQTGPYDQQGASRGRNTAEKVGGGAALGALIGGLIGHGKGAGIGAAVGGAAGTADQTATHGQQVTLPSETKIDFTLTAPFTVTLNPGY